MWEMCLMVSALVDLEPGDAVPRRMVDMIAEREPNGIKVC